MNEKIRVLITCVGSGVGQSAIDSLRNQKDNYFIVASDQNRFVYSVPDCDYFVDLPRIADPDYVKTVQSVCKEYDIDVLIPGHDHELELFATEIEAFESVGTQVLVSDYPLVKLLRNKLEWAKTFRKKTDVVVRSFSLEEILTEPDPVFPMIAKPAGGSASSGLHILHSLEDTVGLPDGLVVQDFLFPVSSSSDFGVISEALKRKENLQISEISVQLLYSRDGEIIGRFASQNRLSNGVPVEIIPIDSEEVWDAVSEIETVLADLKPRGPINLQGRLTDSGLIFFEMNPRFTGITGNRMLFGFNEVDAACRNFVNGERPSTPINYGKVGVRQVACRTWPKKRFAFSGSVAAPKNFLVLGGTSWLGRTFANLCKESDAQIVFVSRPQSVLNASRFFKEMPHVEVVSSDDPGILNYFGWADVLINLASARPPSGTEAIQASHVFQTNWLTKSAVANIPVIVNVSSQSVYKAANEAWSESSETTTSTPYAFSKFAIETQLSSLQQMCPQTSIVSLRMSRLFGASEGMRPVEFPHKVVENALANSEMEVKAPDTVMDLLDVRDAARALQFFASGKHTGLYNVGSNSGISVRDYLDRVSASALAKGFPSLRYKIVDDGDTNGTIGGFMNCAKAQSAGWTPKYDLDASIYSLIDRLSSFPIADAP